MKFKTLPVPKMWNYETFSDGICGTSPKTHSQMKFPLRGHEWFTPCNNVFSFLPRFLREDDEVDPDSPRHFTHR